MVYVCMIVPGASQRCIRGDTVVSGVFDNFTDARYHIIDEYTHNHLQPEKYDSQKRFVCVTDEATSQPLVVNDTWLAFWEETMFIIKQFMVPSMKETETWWFAADVYIKNILSNDKMLQHTFLQKWKEDTPYETLMELFVNHPPVWVPT